MTEPGFAESMQQVFAEHERSLEAQRKAHEMAEESLRQWVADKLGDVVAQLQGGSPSGRHSAPVLPAQPAQPKDPSSDDELRQKVLAIIAEQDSLGTPESLQLASTGLSDDQLRKVFGLTEAEAPHGKLLEVLLRKGAEQDKRLDEHDDRLEIVETAIGQSKLNRAKDKIERDRQDQADYPVPRTPRDQTEEETKSCSGQEQRVDLRQVGSNAKGWLGKFLTATPPPPGSHKKQHDLPKEEK